MKGRKAAPEHLRVLKDTRPCRAAKAAAPSAGLARPPAYLDDDARGEWARVAAFLESHGWLAPDYGPALGLYCDAFSRLQMARADIASNGVVCNTDLGGMKANPAVAVAEKASAQMLKVLALFGLTPASRASVKPADKPKADDLADFLGKKA